MKKLWRYIPVLVLVIIAVLGSIQAQPTEAQGNLEVTQTCSSEPEQVRVWQISNTGNRRIQYQWELVGGPQRGRGSLQAGETVVITTQTLAGNNILRVYSRNTLLVEMSHNGTDCDAPAAPPVPPVDPVGAESTQEVPAASTEAVPGESGSVPGQSAGEQGNPGVPPSNGSGSNPEYTGDLPLAPCGRPDCSSISVRAMCTGNDALFVIANGGEPGNGDMVQWSQWRVYVNDALVNTGSFLLAGGASGQVVHPSNGAAVRLEADQQPWHPGSSNPRETISCGSGSLPPATPTDVPTNTPDVPTNTPTDTPVATDTPTDVPPTATDTPTNTPTDIPPTATDTPTNTPTDIPPTATDTPTNTPTDIPPTATDTPTNTPTDVPPTATDTPTNTPTDVPPTNTPDPGSCDIQVAAADVPGLTAAINQANANADHTVICLTGSTYGLGSTALPALATSIEIQGSGATITASGIRIFQVTSAVQLGQLTLVGGSATNGGAIFNLGGSLTLQSVTIIGSSAARGGAIYNDNATLTITDSTLESNSASDAGGAVYSFGASTVTISTSTFNANSAAMVGGAVANYDGSLTVSQTIFTNQQAQNGGAIYNNGFASTTVQDSVFENNTATFFGAALSTDSSTASLTTSCIIGNTSAVGDVSNFAAGAITATNNWWGAADGPGGSAPGSGDTIYGNVTYIPFSSSALTVCGG